MQISVGDKVRNIKTRAVGEVTEIESSGLATIRLDEIGGEIACRLDDLEALNEFEYMLVKKLVQARASKKEADELAKEAASAATEAEDAVVEYLRKNSLESTKGYDGLGIAVIDGMKVMPSITEENKPAAYEALRAMGRGEVIKESVHPATLSALVSELLDSGKEIPASIGYFLKPKLSVKKK